jgi:hypothetical protein
MAEDFPSIEALTAGLSPQELRVAKAVAVGVAESIKQSMATAEADKVFCGKIRLRAYCAGVALALRLLHRADLENQAN